MPPNRPDATDLAALAHRLLTSGPVRILSAAPKRVRAQLAGRFVADTTHAIYVWEHPYYPYYYVPLSSLATGSWKVVRRLEDGMASVLRLMSGDGDGEDATVASTERVLAFGEDVGAGGDSDSNGDDDQSSRRHNIRALRNMVRIEFSAADGWFEEDTAIAVHPKDPFKRVDIVHSTRPLTISAGGQVLARASSAHHLFETGLPTRYYLPVTSIGVEGDATVRVRPSSAGTRTSCPYKGEAEYYDVIVGTQVLSDLVWSYRHPTLESGLIAGELCFFNERVDIELDGVSLERPQTLFA